jgi:hypothetical protein
MAFGSCLLPPSGYHVPRGGGPGRLAARPAIVQQMLRLPGSAFGRAAIEPLQCLMEWMVCILGPIQTGFDRLMNV